MSYRGLKLAAGGVGAVAALEFAGFGPFTRSKGVENIENSWSRGGGSHVHTPAVASKRGDADNVVGDHGHMGGFGNPSTVRKINEAKQGSDNVVVSRNRRVDRDTPGGSGTAEQKPDQPAQNFSEPLSPGSPDKAKSFKGESAPVGTQSPR